LVMMADQKTGSIPVASVHLAHPPKPLAIDPER
jgi:hypothetical protein